MKVGFKGAFFSGVDIKSILLNERYNFSINDIKSTLLNVSNDDPLKALNKSLELPASALGTDYISSLLLKLLSEAGDSATMSWFEANADKLSLVDDVAILQDLLSFDHSNLLPVLSGEEQHSVAVLIDGDQFEHAAKRLEDLASGYGDVLDKPATFDLLNRWARVDPEAATDWLIKEYENIGEPQSIELLTHTYRQWGLMDPEAAIESGLQYEDEIQQAKALSNLTIAQVEQRGVAVETKWI